MGYKGWTNYEAKDTAEKTRPDWTYGPMGELVPPRSEPRTDWQYEGPMTSDDAHMKWNAGTYGQPKFEGAACAASKHDETATKVETKKGDRTLL